MILMACKSGGCPKKAFECKSSSLKTVFTDMGIWYPALYYYNKVTRTSKRRMPDEVKLARDKDTISHASNFGSISVVKTSSPVADGSLVSAHGAKLIPIAVSPAANLPTIIQELQPLWHTLVGDFPTESMADSISPVEYQTYRQRPFRSFGFGNARHGQGPGLGHDKLGIKAWLMVPGPQMSVKLHIVSFHASRSYVLTFFCDSSLCDDSGESSSLSGKVSSPMIETVEMKNSLEPASPAVADSEKIGIAVTLGNFVAPPVSETTTTQDAVVYGDGFSSENRENVKKDAAITEIGGATPSDEKTVELGPLVYESKVEAKNAFKTLLESANIGSDCMWDQAMRAVIKDRRYGALKSLGERKQAFNEIKDFAAYLVVSSNSSGSTAKVLFTDVMDELEKQAK
ncbi:hypothetical protein CQW23_29168 [Capsicum baccatum]|uniref:FF domain-containing protein n=1 Tax=Capsicum baccatum TaxID=33114 RepID=A0A2G2VIK3_CAPBA|nr:hypothetical protein CQW23_29168 [Capsicum baccatum]